MGWVLCVDRQTVVQLPENLFRFVHVKIDCYRSVGCPRFFVYFVAFPVCHNFSKYIHLGSQFIHNARDFSFIHSLVHSLPYTRRRAFFFVLRSWFFLYHRKFPYSNAGQREHCIFIRPSQAHVLHFFHSKFRKFQSAA